MRILVWLAALFVSQGATHKLSGHSVAHQVTVTTPRSDFLRAMKDTARSRFQGHKRLSVLDKQLTTIVSLSTAYIIVLTVCPYILKSPTFVADMLNLCTVIFSIVVLVGSLLQYSSQNSLTAEQLHRSALEINEIRRELQYVSDAAGAGLKPFIERYNIVLQKYSLNHSSLDYHGAILESSNDYPWVTESDLRSYRLEAMLAGAGPRAMFYAVNFTFIILLSVAFYYWLYPIAKSVADCP